jgi:hypothetical protein
MLLNRVETIKTLRPFLDLILFFKQEPSTVLPVLRELALLTTTANTVEGLIKRRIDRIYFRLCRAQEELGSLDFKKAYPSLSPGTTLEDFVFSRIDFSRYRKITEADFESLFLEGVADFSGSFFEKKFNLGKVETQLLVKECYEKANGVYRLQKENPLILSVMRTLEISLETSPLFTIEEIQNELDYLQGLVGANTKMPEAKKLFSLLLLSLENVDITHKDGMVTKLFTSPQDGLSGIFRPGDKPWTRVLIPADQLA